MKKHFWIAFAAFFLFGEIAHAQYIGPNPAGSFSPTNLTNGACGINSTTQTACANWFGYVNPVWMGTNVCTGSGDDTGSFIAAENLAFTIHPTIGMPIHIPPGQVCQKQSRWQIGHDAVTIEFPAQVPVYDGGSHANEATRVHENTGFTTNYYSQGNCAIDLNGHHDLTVKHGMFLGDGAQQGTVEFCDSTTYLSGQLPTITLIDTSVQLMGSAGGGPINTNAYTGSSTGTCTGSLCGNYIKFNIFDSDLGENGWALIGNVTDAFIYHSTLNADACGGVTGYSTTTFDVLSAGNRIEAAGFGLSNTCPAGGPGFGVNGLGWSDVGSQFEVNAGPDIALLTGWGNFHKTGGHFLGGGSNGAPGSESSILLNATSSAGGATIDSDWRKLSTVPLYAIESLAGDVSNHIVLRGNLGANGYNTAATHFLGTTPSDYLIDANNEPNRLLAATPNISIGANQAQTPISIVNPINAQTTTTPYTILASDMGKTVTHSKSTAVAVTLPQAGTTGFSAGTSYTEMNLGAGTVTITPTTSTINGSATLALTTNQSAFITSDGTNYIAFRSQ